MKITIIGTTLTIVALLSFQTFGGILNTNNSISLEREVKVGPPEGSDPRSILKSSDGGYFVTGGLGPWVSKTDRNGTLLWTYVEPSISQLGNSEFNSSASANDGGILLCGRRYGLPKPYFYEPLIVRLDKDGKETGRIDPYRQDSGQPSGFLQGLVCSRSGNGFTVVGPKPGDPRIAKKTKNYVGQFSILGLTSDGSIEWEKDLPLTFRLLSGELRQVGGGRSLLFSRGGAALVDSKGEVLRQTSILPAGCVWTRVEFDVESMQFLCSSGTEGKGLNIIQLAPDLTVSTIEELKFATRENTADILFRSQGDTAYTFVGSSLLLSRVPTFVVRKFGLEEDLKYEFSNPGEGQIDDFVGGDIGEYVLVRAAHSNGESHSVMTFLKIN